MYIITRYHTIDPKNITPNIKIINPNKNNNEANGSFITLLVNKVKKSNPSTQSYNSY
jgi:hypothetical protein